MSGCSDFDSLWENEMQNLNKPFPAGQRLAYSMREAAQALGICERSVWQAIKDGRLKACKLGRSVRIRRDELERFLRDAEV